MMHFLLTERHAKKELEKLWQVCPLSADVSILFLQKCLTLMAQCVNSYMSMLSMQIKHGKSCHRSTVSGFHYALSSYIFENMKFCIEDMYALNLSHEPTQTKGKGVGKL